MGSETDGTETEIDRPEEPLKNIYSYTSLVTHFPHTSVCALLYI